MGVVQVGLPEELASVINQQVEAGRVEALMPILPRRSGVMPRISTQRTRSLPRLERAFGTPRQDAIRPFPGRRTWLPLSSASLARCTHGLPPPASRCVFGLLGTPRTALTRLSWTAHGSSGSRRLSATTS